jgi:hypothetical protein
MSHDQDAGNIGISGMGAANAQYGDSSSKNPDSGLAEIIQIWLGLSSDIRAKILALLREASGNT